MLLCSGLPLAAGIFVSLDGAASISPWLRVVAALVAFVLPGGYLFVLVPVRESWDVVDFVGYGFSFSVALITVLGLITRTLALSIDTVEFVWYMLALLGFAAALYRCRSAPALSKRVRAPMVALVAIVLLQVALFAHSGLHAAGSSKDVNRHHAAVNGFLREDPLGWSEPYYESGNLIADRMYMTYWVLAQALVVKISGMPILLARYLINPFAVIMAVAGMYVFARNLGHRRRSALVYVVLGLFAYTQVMEIGPQAGSQFFVHIILDKVLAAFALAPVAISSAYQFARSNQWRALVAFGISFFAAVAVHSISGGFAAIVLLLWCAFRVIADRRSARNALQIAILTLAIMSPAAILRLNTVENTIYEFDVVPGYLGKKTYIFDTVNPFDNGNPFIAINPLSAGPLTYILVVLVLFSALPRKLSSRRELMLAYAVAVGFGLLPFTAWIYGRLVSFDLVFRVLWIFPYGYLVGYLVETGWAVLRQHLPGSTLRAEAQWRDWLFVLFSMLALLATARLLHLNPRVDFSKDIATATDAVQEWLDIAEYLDAHHDERVWVAGSPDPEIRSGTISMDWKVIALSRFTASRMAYYSSLPFDDMFAQEESNFRLFKADVPVEEKLDIIDRYNIEYLLFSNAYAWIVDALYQWDKQRFELVYFGETVRLVRVHEKSG